MPKLVQERTSKLVQQRTSKLVKLKTSKQVQQTSKLIQLRAKISTDKISSAFQWLLLSTLPILLGSLIVLVFGNLINLGSIVHAVISTVSVSFVEPLDCVRAEPVIYKKLEASSDNVVLLRAYVGDRPTWRNPHHPWRTDSRFKLKGVPTLIRWEDDAIKARLEDHEAHHEHKIDALLS
ncbi:thioredoxin-like protein Clot [Dorcoceras hygrometricum]|uniref:Thioredoxin-like protein Clot n=1 Tax=Dorcoceras hygrometricum TaxID=472368 RepID=A0A2Z7AF77_9LAMI|nr:thioredoxin-like protein Clot [Dorcoceras hygrometricum]